MKKFLRMLKEKKALWGAFGFAFVFFLFYLWSIQSISFSELNDGFGFRVIDNWYEIMWRTRAPFLWESIAVLSLTKSISIFISPISFLLALVLALLVFINLTVAIYTYYLGRVCNVKPRAHGIIGILPAFLTGFACCVPTFIIALGAVFSSFTVFFINIRPFLIPVSIIIMVWGYWWSAKRVTIGLMKTYEANLNARKEKEV